MMSEAAQERGERRVEEERGRSTGPPAAQRGEKREVRGERKRKREAVRRGPRALREQRLHANTATIESLVLRTPTG